jgi:hypothetical protein
MTRGCGPTDPTAADYNVAIVNYRGLTRSDRALWLVQTNSGTIIFQRRYGRGCARMTVANLERHIRNFIRSIQVDPVYAIDFEFAQD